MKPGLPLDRLSAVADPADTPLRRNGSSTNGFKRLEAESPKSGPPTRSSALASIGLDPWRLAEATWRRWYWLIGSACIFAFLAFAIACKRTPSVYTVSVELIHNDGPNKFRTSKFGDAFIPQPLSESAFRDITHSPEFLRRVSQQARPPVAVPALSANFKLSPDRNVNCITLTLLWPDPRKAVELVNILAQESVRVTQEGQKTEAEGVVSYMDERLKDNEKEIKETRRLLDDESKRQIQAVKEEPFAGQPSNLTILKTELQNANRDLVLYLGDFTEAHPKVKAQRAKIAVWQNQIDQETARMAGQPITPTGSPRPVATVSQNDPANPKVRLALHLDELEKAGAIMRGRRLEAVLFAANPLGEYRPYASATMADVGSFSSKPKIIVLTMVGAFLGFVLAACAVCFVEIKDRRIKTEEEVEMVTGLPALASLGDFASMNEAQKSDWAFRTWTMLRGKIVGSSSRGLVCGLTSACNGEGRSTWINLLGRAANKQGVKVLMIATRPTFDSDDAPETLTADPEITTTSRETDSPGASVSSFLAPKSKEVLSHTHLDNPQKIADQLTSPDGPPVVHIPLPGWVWNYERRKQWHAALKHWGDLENVVVLIELPPASMPESVLLAEHIPNLVWLSSDQADRAQTRLQLKTLRHAGCNIIGAVLNRAATPALKKTLLGWVGCFAVFLASGALQAQASPSADEKPAPVPETEAAAPFAPAHKRSVWQEHLTLGPGDVLTLSLFERPELTRNNVVVGPDGRITYLQAESVEASGLTIDELRSKLDSSLGAFYRSPRTIIGLETLRSKRYFVLGSVARRGPFTLDRPVSIVEAVARAGGLETGLRQGKVAEVADLGHAFLARHNQQAPVDFEKLFLHGDFTQNIQVEPDDYLFFPSAETKEAYVLGEVRAPGVTDLESTNTSVVTAIAMQGGFTDRAWKRRVLVIRGSLQHPQTFVVNVGDVLSAAASDFRLEPHDIIYVHYRPWIKVEELLDTAASAFIQAAVIGWTGIHAGPIIRSPIID